MNDFFMLCTPGYRKKTGYYYRSERDKEILNNIGYKEKSTIIIDSFINFFISLFTILKNKYALYFCENIAASLPIAILYTVLRTRRNVVLVYHGSLEDLSSFRFYKLKYIIYRWAERTLIKSGAKIIFVSEVMKNAYEKTYGVDNYFYVSPNIPSDRFIKEIDRYKSISSQELRLDLNLPKERKIVCYCGNSQSWQKSELLIELINQSKDDNLFFLILTLNVDFFRSRIDNNKIENVLIKTVNNNDVPKYLLASDVLYILRDDNETNRFSCPTKLVEYFISNRPILISKGIGDFSSLIAELGSGVVVDSEKLTDIDYILNLLLEFNFKKVPSVKLDKYTVEQQLVLFKSILD